MQRKIIYSLIAIVSFLVIISGIIFIYFNIAMKKTATDDPTVWESDIEAFEEEDRCDPEPKGGILFVGSSSFRFWTTLKKDMSPLPVINRGFGGAKITDIIYYGNRIIFPYRPSIIVFYCGDNDMSTGKIHSPEKVLKNYRKFTAMIHNSLPNTSILFVSIKPSPRRLEYWPMMMKANELIKDFTATDRRLQFIDISKVMINSNGRPREDLMKWDNLHMNKKGYKLWTSIIRPILEKEFQKFTILPLKGE